MDRIISKFEKLFSIRFAHGTFPFSAAMGGALTQNMLIEPDPITGILFKKHDIHFRLKLDMLLCFIRIRTNMDAPLFRLPNVLSLRFLINLAHPLKSETEQGATHGRENIYRFRINVRAAAHSMGLSNATLGPIQARNPTRVFNPGNPGSWTITTANLSGHFGIIDIVTEGSSTNRLYTNVNDQLLFYTVANGNGHEHLFTVHLNH